MLTYRANLVSKYDKFMQIIYFKDVFLPNGKINSTFYEKSIISEMSTKSIRKYKTFLNNEFNNFEFVIEIKTKYLSKVKTYFQLLKTPKHFPAKSYN